VGGSHAGHTHRWDSWPGQPPPWGRSHHLGTLAPPMAGPSGLGSQMAGPCLLVLHHRVAGALYRQASVVSTDHRLEQVDSMCHAEQGTKHLCTSVTVLCKSLGRGSSPPRCGLGGCSSGPSVLGWALMSFPSATYSLPPSRRLLGGCFIMGFCTSSTPLLLPFVATATACEKLKIGAPLDEQHAEAHACRCPAEGPARLANLTFQCCAGAPSMQTASRQAN
jgi:hypothetical protein